MGDGELRLETGIWDGGLGVGGLLEGALGAFVLKGSRGAVALDALDVAAVDVLHVFFVFFWWGNLSKAGRLDGSAA